MKTAEATSREMDRGECDHEDDGDDREDLHPSRRIAHVVTLRYTVFRSTQNVSIHRFAYALGVPKLWTDTIEAHRRVVRDATLDTAAALVSKHGLAAVTMSQIAEETGIGRATLYKYFPDVDAILVAWHERQVAEHVRQLAEIRDREEEPVARLEAVLRSFALIVHTHHGTELASLLHRRPHVERAQRRLLTLVRDLIAEGTKAGDLRVDVAPLELARYCIHALTAANDLPSEAAVRRLVGVTLSGLRRPRRRR